jgi:hypothetical protein
MAANPVPRVENGLAVWHALNAWVASGPTDVSIPFAEDVARLAYSGAIRMRRDFMAVLSLIEAHALLHQMSRERDADGRVVATLDDYAAVRELVIDIVSEGSRTAVNPVVRETVEAVHALDPGGTVPPSMSALARQLGLDTSAASRRAHTAFDGGFLVNDESRPGRPARLRMGEPLPDDVEVLPRVDELVNAESVTATPVARCVHEDADDASHAGRLMLAALDPDEPGDTELHVVDEF